MHGRQLPVTTPLGIVIGFLLAFVSIHFRSFVPILFGMITFAGVLKLRVSEFGATVRSPAPILLFLSLLIL